MAQVHRGEPVAATSAVRRVAAEAVRAAGERAGRSRSSRRPRAQLDPFVKYLLAARGRRAVRDGAHPARARGAVLRVRELAGRLRARRARSARPAGWASRATSRRGRSSSRCAWCARGLAARARVHGVVFQGMGEPLANLDRVLEAIACCREPSALGIDAREITVCTAGLPHGIRRLAARGAERAARRVDRARARRRACASRSCRSTSAPARRGDRRRAPSTRARPGSRRCGRSRCSPASTTPTTMRTRSPIALATQFAARHRPSAAHLDHPVQRDRPAIRSRASPPRGRVSRAIVSAAPAAVAPSLLAAAATSAPRAASSPREAGLARCRCGMHPVHDIELPVRHPRRTCRR